MSHTELYQKGSGRLCGIFIHGKLSDGIHGTRRKEAVCGSVPPGSASHSVRTGPPEELPIQCLCCEPTWTMANFAKPKSMKSRRSSVTKSALRAFRRRDSSVAAILVHQAIRGQPDPVSLLTTVCSERNEGDQVMEVYGKQFHMKIKESTAQERFLGKLAGVSDPETKKDYRYGVYPVFLKRNPRSSMKRKRNRLPAAGGRSTRMWWKAGTGEAAVIKSHHNVGGLPADMKMDLLEAAETAF